MCLKKVVVGKLRIDQEMALEGARFIRLSGQLKTFLNELAIPYNETDTEILIGESKDSP
jgi:hypothetical protein